MSGSEGVWVVRNPQGVIIRVRLYQPPVPEGCTTERLPLATPEMVAVVEAAIAYRRCTLHEIGDNYGCEQDDAHDTLMTAIDAARAAGGA